MARRTSTKNRASSPTKRTEPSIPPVLYVSGCSLLLAGFNGEYFAITNDNGEIRWMRPVHTFLGITIRPTVILFDVQRNVWLLQSDDFWDYEFYHTHGQYNVPPIGRWTNGDITVTNTDPGFTIHTDAIVQLFAILAALVALLAYIACVNTH